MTAQTSKNTERTSAKGIPLPPGGGSSMSGKGRARESSYLRMFKASPSERIDLIRKGVPAEIVVTTGTDMGMSKERLLAFLQFPRTTINRKIARNEALPPEFSERIIGLQKLIGQVENIMAESGVGRDFNAAHWVAQWLEQPLPALANARPADYMDTVEGQELVSGLLARMQSGAYA